MDAPSKGPDPSARLESAAGGRKRGRGSAARRRTVLTGLVVLAAGTAWAFMQPPQGDAFASPSFLSWDWWKYPIERNAFLRVHQVHGELMNVFALPRTSHVWVVGKGGLVAHSADAGNTWESQNLSAPLNQVRLNSPTAQRNARASASLSPQNSPELATQGSTGYLPNGDGPEPLPSEQQQQAPQVTVPRVMGLSLSEAIKQLSGVGLRVSDSDEKLVGSGNYVVTGQYPEQGVQASRGTVVTLRLTLQTRRQANAPPPTGVRQQRPDTQSPPRTDTNPPPSDRGTSPPPLGADSSQRMFFPQLNAVCFADVARGWAVGERGVAFTTTDSGNTWRQEQLGAQDDLLLVACSPDGSVATATPTEVSVWSASRDSSTHGRTPGGTFYSLGWAATGVVFAVTNGFGSNSSDWQYWLSDDWGKTWRRTDLAMARTGGMKGPTRTDVRCQGAADSLPTYVRIIAAIDDGTSIGIDSSGYLWTSDDYWRSCSKSQRQVLAADAVTRTKLAIGTPNVAYAVDGGLHTSGDKGRTWQLRATPHRLRSLTFFDSTKGWAGTVDGHVLRTVNGGRTWQGKPIDSAYGEAVQHLAASTDRNVYAWSGPARYSSGDRGGSWVRANSRDSVAPLFFTSALRGYGTVALDHSASFITADGGRTWSTTQRTIDLQQWDDSTSPDLAHLSFRSGANTDSLVTWVVLEDGRLIRNRGLRLAADSSSSQRLVAAVPVTSTLGYGLDSLGNFTVSHDGGATWSAAEVLPYRRRPAPWWFFPFLPACILATAVAVRRRDVPDDPEQSVADLLVSDRPLRKGDKDVLDFATIAGGLSRFLRNPQTQPPLTIAISGPWGSGKSSLMLMLKEDLDNRGFRTVWFNAWHHQREEALLASLLESIKARVAPKLWTWMGLRFRLRLLRRRFSRYAVPVMLLAPFLAFAIAWLASDWDHRVDELRTLFGSVGNLIGELFGRGADSAKVAADSARAKVAEGAAPLATNPTKTFLALLISIVGTALTYLKGLKTFGVNPSILAKSVASATKVRTLEAQATFRYRFAQDFSEVTKALHPERLVIFIDDLDRCKPEQVLEILEAVNFLVDSGDCVVVLGMDRDRVIGCVAIGIKEVATILAAMKPAEGSPETNGAGAHQPRLVKDKNDGETQPAGGPAALMRQQLDYARHYLEKLVNMEIPIPTATAEGIANVMTNTEARKEAPTVGDTSAADREQTTPNEDGRKRPARPGGRKATGQRRHRSWRDYALPAQFTVAVAASIIAVIAGVRMGRPSSGTQLGAAAPPPVEQDVARTAGDTSATRTRRDSLPTDTRTLALAPLQLVSAAEGERPWFREVFLAVIAAGLLLWLVTPREERRVQDSPGFIGALRAWAPVLHGEFTTPRAAKRFVNHLRFLAMAQRKPGPPRTPVQDFLAALRDVPWLKWLVPLLPERRTAEHQLPATAFKDVALVTLAVVAERYPDWLNDEQFWTQDIDNYAAMQFRQGAKVSIGVPKDLDKALEELRTQFREQGLPDSDSTMFAHVGRRKEWDRLKEWTRMQP